MYLSWWTLSIISIVSISPSLILSSTIITVKTTWRILSSFIMSCSHSIVLIWIFIPLLRMNWKSAYSFHFYRIFIFSMSLLKNKLARFSFLIQWLPNLLSFFTCLYSIINFRLKSFITYPLRLASIRSIQ